MGELMGWAFELLLAVSAERWPWRTVAVVVTIALFIVLILFLP
jgi:hypothetical protein